MVKIKKKNTLFNMFGVILREQNQDYNRNGNVKKIASSEHCFFYMYNYNILSLYVCSNTVIKLCLFVFFYKTLYTSTIFPVGW